MIDAGINSVGSLEAGRRIAEICMAGLGTVNLQMSETKDFPSIRVNVNTKLPVLACLGSQYAGWSLEYKNGETTFRALGSGPARALALKEPLFDELQYGDNYDWSCLVIETSKYPPAELTHKIAKDCGIAPEHLVLILTPTGSLAGVTQIASRVVEVALHKAHEIEFDLNYIVEGAGTTPLPPPVNDSLTAMGRTNDVIILAGQVSMIVDCNDDEAQQLANQLPSSNSPDYGVPFAQKFAEYNYDFFEIDPMLFSPAQVSVSVLSSGNTYHAGSVNYELLNHSLYGSS